MANATQGFWLVNSMPHWPNQRNVGPGPFPDFTYAQSLMCVTLSAASIDVVASNLIVGRPYIYDKLSTSTLSSIFPNFDSWLAFAKTTETNSVAKFESKGSFIV
jgi:hypothetical protein